MNLLSLHTSGHDTGLCLFEHGRLAFAVETERLTRVRHESRVEAALEHLWADGRFRPESIDLLVFSTNVRSSLARIDDFERLHARIGPEELAVEGQCELLGRRVPCLIVAHEAAHAALACHYAGWRDGMAVLVNEGRGTFSRNACFVYRGARLEPIDVDGLPWFGTGFGWSALSYLLGFGHSPSAAGTAMAMGGYGRRAPEAEDLLRAVDPAIHRAPREGQRPMAQPLVDYIERNREFSARADLMHTFQAIFTDTVTDYLRRRITAVGAAHLGLSGGCALNLHTNTVIRRSLIHDVAIPPNCNDAGQALGAALYALVCRLGVRPEPYSIDRCGRPLDEGGAASAAIAAGLRLSSFDPEQLADRLAEGNTVAFCQGASELGPRALGNRSLLASTRRPGMRRHVSERLKERQWFRPLACVVRAETFARTFPGEPPSPHMLFQYPMPAGVGPEVTHADGTCRVQTLERADNPRLYDTLEAYERRSGDVGLINTSLNARGRAIAYDARDALADFPPPAVDVFVFDDLTALPASTP